MNDNDPWFDKDGILRETSEHKSPWIDRINIIRFTINLIIIAVCGIFIAIYANKAYEEFMVDKRLAENIRKEHQTIQDERALREVGIPDPVGLNSNNVFTGTCIFGPNKDEPGSWRFRRMGMDTITNLFLERYANGIWETNSILYADGRMQCGDLVLAPHSLSNTVYNFSVPLGNSLTDAIQAYKERLWWFKQLMKGKE